jgi:hypothetical protein
VDIDGLKLEISWDCKNAKGFVGYIDIKVCVSEVEED